VYLHHSISITWFCDMGKSTCLLLASEGLEDLPSYLWPMACRLPGAQEVKHILRTKNSHPLR
jgi:hypothetical protein